ncbi:neuropeptide Y receptor type 2-like [Biomphalaria glabrata]|uniref:Neuropeptide Y receptor type 2-like n=3 Tax=Biomphalaria TaxID=6525 RepID=A0A9U8EH87_BIOGL|nr:neuropeptide Y receptor type 2-like [Biomphalaria glabrata]
MMTNESLVNVTRPPQQMLYIVQEFTNQTFWFSPSTVIALVISYCVLIVAGLAANIIVIIVICQKKTLRSTRNIYILNLSVCDVIMCSVCMPFSLVKLTLKKWTMGSVMCRIVPALATIDVLVSTLTIIVIALDRYLAIVHTSQVTTRHVVSALLIIWTLAILLSTPLFCFHKIDTQELFQHVFVQQCIDHWPDELFREVYTTVVMLIQYLTPTCFISCLHARICNFLRYRLEERPGSDTQIQTKAREDLKRHRRNMVLLTAMAMVFSVTWLPLTLLNITADLGHEVFQESQYNLLHAISLLLAMSSSLANPVMYGWFNTNFRKAFCELLGFPERSGDVKVSSNDKKNSTSRNKFRNQSKSNSFNLDYSSVRLKMFKKCHATGTNVNRHSLNDLPSPRAVVNDNVVPEKSEKMYASLQDVSNYNHNDVIMSSLEPKLKANKQAALRSTERDSLLQQSPKLQAYEPYTEQSSCRRDSSKSVDELGWARCSPDEKDVCIHLLNVVVEVSPETYLCQQAENSNVLASDEK